MSSGQTIQVMLALIFVVGLLLAVAWIARRSGWIRQRLGRADLKILGTISLGARSSVALIQVEDLRLVVGVTTQQITLLHTFPPPSSAALHSSAAEFSQRLGEAVAKS